MLFNSGEFNCVKEMAVIVAMLQVENVFLNPPGQSAKAKMAKRQFEVSEGDLLTLLNVFNAFQQIDPNVIKHWCSSKFLRSVLFKIKKKTFSSLLFAPVLKIFVSFFPLIGCIVSLAQIFSYQESYLGEFCTFLFEIFHFTIIFLHASKLIA